MTDGVNPLRFSAGTLVRDDLVFIASQIEELNLRGVDHTKMLRWNGGGWGHYMIDWPVTAVRHTTDGNLKIFSLGLHGKIHIASGKDRFVEEVDTSREGPANRGVLRDLRVIGGRVYVVGMQREAYCRTMSDKWERIDQGVVLPLGATTVKSFDSLDGFDANDIYAAGLEGEIWHYDGNRWNQIASPTSVALEKVLCVNEDTIYAAGQRGTLIRGSRDRWEVLASEQILDTIWDLAWFKGVLYVATSRSLYFLAGDSLIPVDFGPLDQWSCGSLACNQNFLWSIGQSHLLLTQDGKKWDEVTCRDASY